MATIQVKNVPDETHAVLRRRAAEAHQSLQEYLWEELVSLADRPTTADWSRRVASHLRQTPNTVTIEDINEVIRRNRESR